MNEEDRILLLNDLCSRLPYKPYVSIITPQKFRSVNWKLEDDIKCHTELTYDILRNNDIQYIRPHLRPMSSMTNDERASFVREAIYELNSRNICGVTEYYYMDYVGEINNMHPNYKSIDWLNKYNFDYRGLIGKDLAIAATKITYKMFKEEEKMPKTLEEAINRLDKELTEEDKKFLLENGALSVHHSLG